MLSEFLVDFLKAVGSPRAMIVGNSMGGHIASTSPLRSRSASRVSS
jgi:pimeloyl-ACP methyl ester carboxylesterase